MRTRFAVFLATSVDGYIARPDGGLDWLKPFEGQEHGYTAFYKSVDAVVIGRGTYDVVLTFPGWAYGRKRVIVCTHRAAAPSHGEEITGEEPRALAERLDREGVERVYLDGGALIRSFLREGLVDEMTITVVPIVLGSGIPLFAAGLPERPLKLVDARTYPSGLVQLRYAL
jgi:dihydrofolate reductase